MISNNTENTITPAPTQTLRIRQAVLRDGPAIVAVIREAFAPVARRFGFTAENFLMHPSNYDAQRYAADRQLGRTFHVAEIDGQIVGVLALRVLDHRTGEIARLAVKPGYQKQGLGAALMVYALTWGRAQDLARLELTMLAPHSALRQWYEGFGFTTTVTRELQGVPLPVTWMSRALRPVTVRTVRRERGQLTAPAAMCGAVCG